MNTPDPAEDTVDKALREYLGMAQSNRRLREDEETAGFRAGWAAATADRKAAESA